ncbi:GDSL esterase/lipase At5g03820 [Ricinus communis]|uniref:Zinc finger protein, putative n=1 Tax=Ricinus communis TaxID=3988 RepID=B9SRK9_RICCO|nr:GDSL esterase/lipase At5g03820 [Ricinus communis]EEF33731.1 zinc finger protein, putative [Ricinus communis]|eukprot:XP_002528628.1 GDSL esterase/lipase At5g03820 [Ricinus communis]
MGFASSFWGTSFCLLVLVSSVANADPIVPALIIFGDSVVDVGNNNNLNTLIKANFPPYGRDFVTHRPTGRFCNGKLATDFTAEYLGFTSYPPAYLSQDAQGRNILTGVNFASAASGLYDGTATLYSAVSLTRQLNYYKEYQTKVVIMVGQAKANDIFAGAIHLLSAGSSDFIQNYYINPLINGIYTPDRFSDNLITFYSSFIQNLYQLGARRIGVTGLPPTGCLPAAITLFGAGSNQCVERLNRDAISFNNKLNSTSQSLVSNLPGLKLVVFDIYQPLLDMILKPTDNGFFEARRACCGTGTLETSVLCNARSLGTCSDATQYVFWDGFHPSEAANKVLAGDLLAQGFDLIS